MLGRSNFQTTLVSSYRCSWTAMLKRKAGENVPNPYVHHAIGKKTEKTQIMTKHVQQTFQIFSWRHEASLFWISPNKNLSCFHQWFSLLWSFEAHFFSQLFRRLDDFKLCSQKLKMTRRKPLPPKTCRET